MNLPVLRSGFLAVSTFASSLCVLAPSSALAQYKFIFSGNAASTAYGYTAGQTLDFEFVMADPILSQSDYDLGGKHPYFHRWTANGMWTSFTGTGISGTLDPNIISNVHVVNTGEVDGDLGVNFGDFNLDTGLTLPDGSTIAWLRFDEITWTNLSIPIPAQILDDPNEYFEMITGGTYVFNNSVGGGAEIYVLGNPPISLNLTTLTVVIPEPSAFALLGGTAVLGVVLTRRPRRAAAA